MNKRKEFIEYVKHEGAGYNSEICGFEWFSQITDMPEENVYAFLVIKKGNSL